MFLILKVPEWMFLHFLLNEAHHMAPRGVLVKGREGLARI